MFNGEKLNLLVLFILLNQNGLKSVLTEFAIFIGPVIVSHPTGKSFSRHTQFSCSCHHSFQTFC